MPGDLWEEALTDNPYSHVLVTIFEAQFEDPASNDLQYFCRPILPSDWTRVNLHVARVKEVVGCRYISPFGYNIRVEPDVYQALIHAS